MAQPQLMPVALCPSLFAAAFPHQDRGSFHASPVFPCPASMVSSPLALFLTTPRPLKAAFLSHLFSFPMDTLGNTLSVSHVGLLPGPACSLDTFSCPSTTAITAAYCDVIHYVSVVYLCTSPTQNSELLETSRPDLEARIDPDLSLYWYSVNASGMN